MGNFRMKRILHVTFNMGIGGTESVIREIVTGCNEVDHEVLCIDGKVGETGQALITEGIPVHCLDRKKGVDLKLIRDISNLAKERNIDILHCHQYTPFFYGGFAAMLTGKQYMLTEHGRHHPDKHRYKSWFINKLLFKLSKSNIAISHYTLNALFKNEFMQKKNSTVIYNGILPIESNPQQIHERKNFVCVARFDQNKNQKTIVDAVHLLRKKGVMITVDFYGAGPTLELVRRYAIELGVSTQCQFYGFIDNPAELLPRYKGLILASFTEGTSMVILESFRELTPVIASRVGGTVELIEDGKSGVLFNPEKAIDLSEAIEKIENDQEFSYIISKTAKEVFNNTFTAKKMCKKYYGIYSR